MQSYAIIVTACNMGPVISRTLASAEAAVAACRRLGPEAAATPAEIVVVDDGSTDDTPARVAEQAAGKRLYRLLHRPRPTSPSAAGNAGVEASTGALLFFLDGDDVFYPEHIAVCQRALADRGPAFAKTRVHLADPVHPDWQRRINHSLVLNLCVRRSCHVALGGFPDYHLFVREGDGFRHRTDLFYKYEDQYYCELLARLFPGVAVPRETVEYLRYPGNGFDRQYAKYRQPFGAYAGPLTAEEHYRLRLCNAVLDYRTHQLRAQLAGQPAGRAGDPSAPSLAGASAAASA